MQPFKNLLTGHNAKFTGILFAIGAIIIIVGIIKGSYDYKESIPMNTASASQNV